MLSEGAEKKWWQNPMTWGWVGTGLMLVVFVVVMVTSSCDSTLIGETCETRWSQFANSSPNEVGDAMAGWAGSLAFLWIVVTVLMQREELQAQREELALTRGVAEEQRAALEGQVAGMAEQRFESAFFEMLGFWSHVVETVTTEAEVNRESPDGRIYYEKNSLKGAIALSSICDDLFLALDDLAISAFNQRYVDFWFENSGRLSHYFRFLFNFFRFLSESEHAKPQHGKLLRSQLSQPELTLLFYNCLSDVGRKFEQYAIEFELFDNMSKDDLIDPSHAHHIDPRVFGPDKRGLLTE